jgi:hypothetical protein
MSLNFNGNYIGGVPSGGGGGTPYILPVASTTTLGGVKIDGTTITINDGVISSEGGGSITVDSTLSNTSENPVQNKTLYSYLHPMSTGFLAPAHVLDLYSAATNTEYSEASLETFLPDDGEQYMVCLWCQVHVDKTTVGNYINVCFDTDLTGTGGFFTAGSLRCVVANQESPVSSIIWVPFGAGRKIKIQKRASDKGTFYIKATGYYRLTYSGS